MEIVNSCVTKGETAPIHLVCYGCARVSHKNETEECEIGQINFGGTGESEMEDEDRNEEE